MMPEKQMPPTPGGAGSGAEKNSARSGEHSQAAAKASRKRWEWFKFWTDDWHVLVRGLKAEQRGVLIELLVLMHEDRRPVAEDCDWLATAAGTTRATIKKIVDRLVELGIIERKNGGLWSAYMQRQIDDQGELSENKYRAAKKRFQKTKRNQSDVDADAYRGREDKEDKEGEGSKEPSPLHSDSEPVGDHSTSGSAAESVDKPHRPFAPEAQAGAVTAPSCIEDLKRSLDLGEIKTVTAFRQRVDQLQSTVAPGHGDLLSKTAEVIGKQWFSLEDWTVSNHEREDDDDIPY